MALAGASVNTLLAHTHAAESEDTVNSGKILREKLCRENFRMDCLHYRPQPQNFTEKTFTDGSKMLKFSPSKVFHYTVEE